ncbi:MAG: DUF6680 family protein [Marivita sp.]|uniref:DUF6680 family protein n=1 Tax=Marivita sp. TaxID=2003365 RepID=UPI003EF5C1C2
MIVDLTTILTLIAILAGPMLGVYLTRRIDLNREKSNRRYAVLSDLMKTRRARIDPIHVSALNLVELEFYGKNSILSPYKNYTDHLNSSWPTEPDALQRHMDKGDDLFSDLLSSIANEMGFKFDKRDLDRRGYLPVGLGNAHSNQMANAQLLREVLEGSRSLQVATVQPLDSVPQKDSETALIEQQLEMKPR